MDNVTMGNENYYAPQDLKDAMKLLWLQQIMWTRSLMVSTISALPDLEVVSNRLFESPKDFSNLFEIYYGKEIAGQLEDLLRKHLTLTVNLINSYKMAYSLHQPIENSFIIKQIEQAWYDNAKQISSFLSGINPNWNEEQLQTIFRDHLDMTKDEIIKHLYGQYAADVYQYDFIEYHILMLSDILSNGIIKQFYT